MSSPAELLRIENKYFFDTSEFRLKFGPEDARWPKDRKIVGPSDPVPFNMTVFKGGKSWQLPRSFVWFLLYHPVSKRFQGD